jgi:signal transduction histidine kinase
MKRILAAFLRTFTFQRQLGITVTVGILCLTLFSSLVSSWQGNERVRRDLIEQGQRITENLARQSALALLYASADNAAEAVNSTLAFPGVVSVEIRDVNRRVLLARGRVSPGEFSRQARQGAGPETSAILDAESRGAWRFVAPVHSRPSGGSPFQVQEASRELLGYVSVVVSKATLAQMTADMFVANMTTSFSFALLFLVLIRLLTNRMTRPLSQLSASMARAEAGEFRVRAPAAGPKDIVDLAHAFNRMMTVLEEREADLRHLNETLEQRVAEEVAKNREKDGMLIQQSRLAAMGEMIGNIAHQWRQPINALTLLLSNIKDAYNYNELDQEYLDKAVKNGQQIIQKMSTTIDDFRNFFRPNKEMQNFRACEGVAEAVKMVEQSFQSHNIEISLVRSGGPCEVTGYPNEFAQVVLNALTNAKDAIVSRKIAGKVHIRVEKGPDAVTVFIRDNGGGIPEGILGKVFDPYFTTKEKGTGIGLYMSKMIMDNMDGDIAIRNVEDGAEVSIRVPLAPRTGDGAGGGR